MHEEVTKGKTDNISFERVKQFE